MNSELKLVNVINLSDCGKRKKKKSTHKKNNRLSTTENLSKQMKVLKSNENTKKVNLIPKMLKIVSL